MQRAVHRSPGRRGGGGKTLHVRGGRQCFRSCCSYGWRSSETSDVEPQDVAPVVLLANTSIAIPLKSAVLGAELLELELSMLGMNRCGVLGRDLQEHRGHGCSPRLRPVQHLSWVGWGGGGGQLLVLPPRLTRPTRRPSFVPVQTSL